MRETESSSNADWQVPEYKTEFWFERKHAACVIIPVINEGRRIADLLARMAALGTSNVADILIVDGGSTDNSLSPKLLVERGVRGLLVKIGSGRLGAQLRCGYAFALDRGYNAIVTIDGNNKDDPEAIPRFLDAISGGVDFVQASRFLPGGLAQNTPMVRVLAIRCVHAPLLRLFSGFPWTDSTQGFRAYTSRILRDPRVAPFRQVFSSYELLPYMSCRIPKLGYRCLELATTRSYPEGKVPTKISAFRGNLSVLAALIGACLGRYDPR